MPKKKSKKAQVIEAPYSNDRWEAEEDARTLARAAAIKKDQDRMKKAKSAAKNLLPEHEKRAEESKHTVKIMRQLAESK